MHVVITGASRGIGAGLAQAYADSDHKVTGTIRAMLDVSDPASQAAFAATLGTDTSEIQDNLTDLIYDLKAGYRRGGSWLMNSATAGTIRKLQDADNRQIWTESLMAGQPNTPFTMPFLVWMMTSLLGAI